ncbi:MAG: hypothetical protein LPK09_05725 [Hymenobacteraceae bacterium]|nr:hypothetical protein [Hymenobacteraceae bacterium]
MTKSIITIKVYNVVLLAFVLLNVVGGLGALVMEFKLVTLASFSINAIILVLYYTKSRHLSTAVKMGAVLVLAGAVIALFPLLFIGFFYGMKHLWLYVPIFLISPVLGLYLYKGSSRYIEVVRTEDE